MTQLNLTNEEERVMQEVDELRSFYKHALSFLIFIPMLWILNWYQSSDSWWAIWPTLGWGIGLASHAFSTFNILKLFGPEWERREIQKRLNKRP